VKQYQSAQYSSFQGTCSFWSSCHCVFKQKTSVTGYALSVRRHIDVSWIKETLLCTRRQ